MLSCRIKEDNMFFCQAQMNTQNQCKESISIFSIRLGWTEEHILFLGIAATIERTVPYGRSEIDHYTTN